MIKLLINKNEGQEHCYQVNGTMDVNGKNISFRFFAFADDEDEAKIIFNEYKQVRLMKLNFQTLGDAQNAYRKEFGSDVELDSVEFANYIKQR